MSENVVLEVRNPRSDISQEEPHALPPRLDTLEGKRIAVMTIKPDADIYTRSATRATSARWGRGNW